MLGLSFTLGPITQDEQLRGLRPFQRVNNGNCLHHYTSETLPSSISS